MINDKILELVNISKHYGEIKAVNDVSFSINNNEIAGLVGDNGAGKSTLMKIIMGAELPDKGDIYYGGKKVKFKSPYDARLDGIELVYQNLALVELMNVYRNFFLGREIMKKIGPFEFLNRTKMAIESTKALSAIGMKLKNSENLVSTLSGGERQSIAISRAFYFGASLLLLDEPVAALSVKETKKVFETLQKLKEKKEISIIIVAHNIYQIYSIVDKFIVVAHGRKITDIKRKDVKPKDIIEMISSS